VDHKELQLESRPSDRIDHGLIVIGASSGGLAPLRSIMAALPADLPAAICVVQHIGDHPSNLTAILDNASALRVVEAEDGSPIRPGIVYVAPPSNHLIIGPGHLHLSHGPRENFARPAVDPLFRSAAEHLGPRLIGVILSGQLNDGTVGLYEIKRRGGLTVVQDRERPSIPECRRALLTMCRSTTASQPWRCPGC
jgi:two-component system chemotaxis response regulator CheB